MKAFFDERQLLHAPKRELHNGDWSDYQETPSRAATIAAHFDNLEAPENFGLDSILAVHTPDYVELLRTAHQ